MREEPGIDQLPSVRVHVGSISLQNVFVVYNVCDDGHGISIYSDKQILNLTNKL